MLRAVVTSCVAIVLICESSSAQASPALAVTAALLPAQVGVTINIVAGDALLDNPAALGALNRAAAQW